MNRPVLIPALLLAVLLAAVDLWSMHHFGVGISNPGVLAVILTALGVGWGWAAKLLTKEEAAEVQAAADSVVAKVRRYLLSPALVLVLYAAFAVAVLLFSSITVVAEPGAGSASVTVSPLGDPAEVASDRLEGGRGQVRFGVATSPLAGAYVVRASGYLPAVVEAAPLVGARLQLGRDVARAPALLLRPPELLMGVLRNGGHITVSRVAGGDTTEVARSDEGAAGSFLVGRRSIGLGERSGRWERQLMAAGVTDGELVNQHLEDWMEMHVLAVEGALVPGDTLIVSVQAPSGEESARERVVLGAEDVVDVFLRSMPGPGGAP